MFMDDEQDVVGVESKPGPIQQVGAENRRAAGIEDDGGLGALRLDGVVLERGEMLRRACLLVAGEAGRRY